MIDAIPCHEARRLLESGGQLIDVRGPGEYAAGALRGAQNMPVEAFPSHVHRLDPARPVLLYCKSGARSGAAKGFLQQLGFRAVYNIGAYQAWRECAETG
ncbi:MAG: rhodanese-like domain-containing protein [Gammaproteobacteria bacterium]|nr:rhodanese-like domain-containing protein [Gammaproteobacteria bacterium]